jgi:hypothetical protein
MELTNFIYKNFVGTAQPEAGGAGCRPVRAGDGQSNSSGPGIGRETSSDLPSVVKVEAEILRASGPQNGRIVLQGVFDARRAR